MPPDDKGIYVLVVETRKKLDITVGKLGMMTFMPGKYLYVGRAKQHLNGRLKRHLRKDKKRFWHIDYLLHESQLEEIWIKRNFFDECRTAASIQALFKESAHFIRGFGSSDCQCPGHLIHLPGQEGALPQLQKKLVFEKAEIHGNQS